MKTIAHKASEQNKSSFISTDSTREPKCHKKAETQKKSLNITVKDPYAVDFFDFARRAQKTERTRYLEGCSVKVIAPAKVNLFLDIGNRRPDGYHSVNTVMHTLSFHDVLYLKTEATQNNNLEINVTCEFAPNIDSFDIKTENNLAYKAIKLLAEETHRKTSERVSIHIEKNIPAQAGLGGGSSDAAAALVGAASLWGLDENDPVLYSVASRLGADVAFFLTGGCAYLTGVGEEIHHSLEASSGNVVLIKPHQGISTARAYQMFDAEPHVISQDKKKAAFKATEAHQVPLENNLLKASEKELPEVAKILNWLSLQQESKGSLMSGSGSACFALCSSLDEATRLASRARVNGWWVRSTSFSSSCCVACAVQHGAL